MTKLKNLIKDTTGDAVVEATILFPIMIMIFFAFILLAMYLPTSVALQRSVEKAAYIISAQQSDLGYTYEISTDKAGINYEKLKRENVYIYMMRGFSDEEGIVERIVGKYAADALYAGKNLSVELQEDPNDKRYMLITAKQTLELPFDFSILPVSNVLELKKSARIMNRDVDEFIRSMDIVYDLVIKKADAVKDTLGDIENFLELFNKIKGFFEF